MNKSHRDTHRQDAGAANVKRGGYSLCAKAVSAVLVLSATFMTMPAFAADVDLKAVPAKPLSPIKHVVVIIPENRTFDNYFGTYPNAANLPFEESWVGVPAPKFFS